MAESWQSSTASSSSIFGWLAAANGASIDCARPHPDPPPHRPAGDGSGGPKPILTPARGLPPFVTQTECAASDYRSQFSRVSARMPVSSPLRPVLKNRLVGSLDQGEGTHQSIGALLRFFQ